MGPSPAIPGVRPGHGARAGTGRNRIDGMKKIPGNDGGQAASLLRRCVVAVFAFCIPLVASDYLT